MCTWGHGVQEELGVGAEEEAAVTEVVLLGQLQAGWQAGEAVSRRRLQHTGVRNTLQQTTPGSRQQQLQLGASARDSC